MGDKLAGASVAVHTQTIGGATYQTIRSNTNRALAPLEYAIRALVHGKLYKLESKATGNTGNNAE